MNDLRGAVRHLVTVMEPAETLRHGAAVRESIDVAGRPNPAKFARLRTPLALQWPTGATGTYQAVARPGTAILIRARAGTAPSGGPCIVTLKWESASTGLTTLGEVRIPAGRRFGEAQVEAYLATLPAGAWVVATVTTANDASGVSAALTIDVS